MIICENCTNFRDMEEAKEMIRVAKECGASLSKFQLFDAADDKEKPYYEWVKAHQLTFDQAKMLFDYGKEIGMEVFFSVFKPRFVEWCEKIGVKRYKVACSQKDNGSLIIVIQGTYKPVIISSNDGRCFWADQQRELPLMLYCTLEYPASLSFMPNFMEDSYYKGFSDHTVGLDASKIALARGALIIEKHFVLKHDSCYPDDAWSMTPDELKELVRWEKVCKEVLR